MPSLIVYSKDRCQACDTAKAVLKSKNLDFTEKNIDHDLEALRFVVQNKHRAMPVVYDGDTWVQDIQTL